MKLKELLERVKQQYQKITPKVRKLILVGACLVILFSVGTAVFLNNKPYETLFSGLNQEEATEIMGKLQEMGVDYKYETDGAILVPSEQEEALKAQLVNEGYPKSGFTYDIFKDNIGMTTTDFEKNSYKLFELQNRMGATIRLFE
ncbi:MAG: flagellar M-ring protein FliF, partial [Anaerotignum sp.]